MFIRFCNSLIRYHDIVSVDYDSTTQEVFIKYGNGVRDSWTETTQEEFDKFADELIKLTNPVSTGLGCTGCACKS